jgi:hypothetical protein
VLSSLKLWAARQIERRLRREWQEYRAQPEIRSGLFGRRARPGTGPRVSRSLIQINFYKDGGEPR